MSLFSNNGQIMGPFETIPGSNIGPSCVRQGFAEIKMIGCSDKIGRIILFLILN